MKVSYTWLAFMIALFLSSTFSLHLLIPPAILTNGSLPFDLILPSFRDGSKIFYFEIHWIAS